MAHGKPDWNRTNAPVTTYRVDDPGEAAVRLGSIVSHDRRGDVVALDDFEAATLHWGTDLQGAGAAAALDTGHARSGEQCVQLTGGSDGNEFAMIERFYPFPVDGKLGMEISWVPAANIDGFRIRIFVYKGAPGATFYVITWDDAAQTIVGLGDSGDFTIATSVDFDSEEFMWHTWKLVIDTDAEEYVRLITNNVEYDLSGNKPPTSALTKGPFFNPQIRVNSRTGQNDICRVDDFILTQNEP